MEPVTVVTCTFGRPELLKRAVASVQAQTYRDVRHLIVEDAGNVPSAQGMDLDGAQVITMGHRTGWPGFICRNLGAQQAETELIAFLDDDNWYEPEHLETLVGLLRERNADFVWASSRLWRKDCTVIGYRRNGTAGPGTTDISEILCKRALFIGSRGLDPRDGTPGDGCMVDRWVVSQARFAHSYEVTLNYTVNDEESVRLIEPACALGRDGYSLEEF